MKCNLFKRESVTSVTTRVKSGGLPVVLSSSQSGFTLIYIFILACFMVLNAQTKSTITITAGGDKITVTETGKALSAVLQEVNRIADGQGDLSNVQEYFTPTAFADFQQLVTSTGLFSTIPEYRLQLLQTADGKYEVRGIKVRVRMGDTSGDDIQEMVFTLNFRLFIVNVQFAMENHHYVRLLDEGRKLDDMVLRQKILGFLEDFRTAHNRKDISYLERAYSDDALIIVGRVLERQDGGGDYLAASSLSSNKIEFIKLSKKQYIERLRNAFAINSFVNVIFDEANIIRHSKYPEIYGVKLRQRWNSSTYSDEGHLFVMMDFYDPEKPLIHVRAWQPEAFDDGSLVGLGDFEIIE